MRSHKKLLNLFLTTAVTNASLPGGRILEANQPMQELSLKSGGGRNFRRGRNLGRVYTVLANY